MAFRSKFPIAPPVTLEASSEYVRASSASLVLSSLSFASTSSARFFASAFERVTSFGASSAPLYATRMCAAPTISRPGALGAPLGAADGSPEAGRAGATADPPSGTDVGGGAASPVVPASSAPNRQHAGRTTAQARRARAVLTRALREKAALPLDEGIT